LPPLHTRQRSELGGRLTDDSPLSPSPDTGIDNGNGTPIDSSAVVTQLLQHHPSLFRHVPALPPVLVTTRGDDYSRGGGAGTGGSFDDPDHLLAAAVGAAQVAIQISPSPEPQDAPDVRAFRRAL